MKNKILLVIAAILLILPCTGCITDDEETTNADPFVKLSQFNASINTLQSQIAERPTLVTITELIKTTINSNAKQIDAYTKNETYNKSEVDARINETMATLRMEMASYQTSQSSGATTQPSNPASSDVVFVTSPVSIPQLFTAASGSQSTFYTIKIINNTSTWQYVKPIINMTLASSYSPTVFNSIDVNMTHSSYVLTNANFSISPALGASTSSLVIIPISGGGNNAGEFQIAAGSSIDILVQISNVSTTSTVLWNITNSISSRNL